MSHVSLVSNETADPQVATLLESYQAEHGKVPALWQVLGNYPPLLEAHAAFYRATVQSGTLDQTLKELVGVVVSTTNDCAFCVASHRANAIRLFGLEGERVDAIAGGDWSDLSKRERLVLEYARQCAVDPKAITRTFIDDLREVGLSDARIVELTGAIAQFVVANLYADALGLVPAEFEGYNP